VKAAWRAWWQGLAARERALVGIAALLVTGALLWWLAIAPALAALRRADAALPVLDAQLQVLRAQQARAEQLKLAPRPAPDEARRALEAAVRERLGAAAQAVFAGERATLTLKGVSANRLAEFLAQARANARSLPLDARLTRGADGASWSGTLVMGLAP